MDDEEFIPEEEFAAPTTKRAPSVRRRQPARRFYEEPTEHTKSRPSRRGQRRKTPVVVQTRTKTPVVTRTKTPTSELLTSIKEAKQLLRGQSPLEGKSPGRALEVTSLSKGPEITIQETEELAPVIVASTIAKTKDAPVVGALSRQELFDSIALPSSDTDLCVREQENAKVLGDYLLSGRLGGDSVAGEAHRMCKPYVCTDQACGCRENGVRLAVKLIPFGSDIPGTARAAYSLIVEKKLGFHDPLVLWKVNNEHGVEITAMTLLNELVLQGICPNLPLMFRYYVCDTCDLVNQALMGRDAAWTKAYTSEYNENYGGKRGKNELYGPTIGQVQAMRDKLGVKLKNPCIVVVNELANGGDLEHVLQHQYAMILSRSGASETSVAEGLMNLFPSLNPNEEGAALSSGQKDERRRKAQQIAEKARTSTDSILTASEVNSMAFQIVAGLYAMKKYYNMRHFDLHWGNVLIHKLPHTDGVLKYHIDGVDYYVPTYGRLYVIWDFGRVIVPGKMQAFRSNAMYADIPEALRDMTQIAGLIDNGLNGAPGVVSKLAVVDKWQNYGDVLRDVFSDYRTPRDGVTSSWNMDKKLRPFKDKNLQRLVVKGMSA